MSGVDKGCPTFTTVAHVKANPRTERLRERVSRVRALVLTALGHHRGYFIQYPYAGNCQRVSEPYPEVAALCEAAPWQEFLNEIAQHRRVFETFTGTTGPRLGRGMFPAIDGMSTYSAVRKFKPKRIVEIGSGDSTYFLAAGVKDNGSGQIICIDPEPRRRVANLDVVFNARLMNTGDARLAESLESGDILFIDSSHIMLPGLDVDIQFNRLFPRLATGVIVHIHDVFLPDDYPAHWQVRNYSEQNALIGWLISGYFEIVWPSQYMITRHTDAVERVIQGLGDLTTGGSLWLRKT